MVVSIISHGLRLELLSLPEQERVPHRLLMPEQEAAFAQEIDALLLKRGIRVLDFYQEHPAPRTHVAVGFCVPKPAGWRPVIDWRELNWHILKRHFKMESLQTVRQLVQRGDYLVKIDIKDAYLHIPVAEEHQPFLRFNFLRRTYQCLVMLFGLTSAPRIFTRVMLPVVRKLRDEGIRVVIYLDDILIIAANHEQALQHRDRTLQLLQELGWLVNWDKSVLTPAKKLTYLGVHIDTEEMTFSLPTEKLSKLANSVAEMLDLHRKHQLTVRLASKVLGSMTAAAAGIELARLHERPLLQEVQVALSAGAHWDDPIRLSPSTREACNWWRSEILAWNGIRIIEPSAVTHVLTTDASARGFGVTIRAYDQSLDLRTQWRLPERQESRSSNWRELSAIAFALNRLGEAIKGATLCIRSDNTTSLACIRNQGSRYQELTDVARGILLAAARHNIWLATEFVPGIQNVEADHLSRWFFQDPAGYQLHPLVLQEIQRRWGPLSIDLFASEANRLLPRFFSWGYAETAEGTDAFRQQWPERALAHPPPNLIGRVLQKVLRDRVRNLILIVPSWRQAWWPTLQTLMVMAPIPLSSVTAEYLVTCGSSSPPADFRRWRHLACLLSADCGGASG